MGLIEKKGLSLCRVCNTRCGVLLFSLNTRLPTWPVCNLPLRVPHSPRLPLKPTTDKSSVRIHTHTRSRVQIYTHAHAHKHKYPIRYKSSRVLGPVFMYMYTLLFTVCYLPAGIVGQLVYFFRLTLASPEECINGTYIPYVLYKPIYALIYIIYVRFVW